MSKSQPKMIKSVKLRRGRLFSALRSSIDQSMLSDLELLDTPENPKTMMAMQQDQLVNMKNETLVSGAS